MKLVLEQRYLFDGSAAAVAHHAHFDHNDHDGSPRAETPGHATQGDGTSQTATPPAFDVATAGRRGAGETVLFVDQTVTDWQALVAGVKPGVDIIVLNPNQDGITQVTQALAGLSNVKTVEFLTDGTPGSITLGSTTLDAATLTARASEIAAWSNHLAANADVVFWGCDVGEGSIGQAFVADVHTLTGATVGASSDATGAAALGGDWTLEVTTGPLHRDVNPFTAATLASYTGILDTPAPTVTLGLTPGIANTTSGTVLLGDTLTASVTFANDAANATGYGPYVDLFVPAGLTLSTTSYAGGSLTVEHVALSGSTVINPLTKATESVPTGDSGGTLYVIELPYGSFTPGEPAISFSATFQMASTPALVGTLLGVEAIGGFQYGAVATGGSNIEGSSVTSSDTVELIESYATVNTLYGEDETATGPDFPVQYVVHLLTAPAVTAGDPIDGLSLALTLPNDVIYSNAVTYGGAGLTASGGGNASVSNASADGGTVQTLNVSYATLSGSQTIDVPVYVPENYQYTSNGDTVNTPILDPTSGAPVEVIITPPYDYSGDSWNGISLASETGNVTPASFDAKSLAVQLTADPSDAVPGEDIGYTMHFEVSDYFGISALTLNALMHDGLTFDPTVTPILTVGAGAGDAGGSSSFAVLSSNTSTINSETVQTSGGGTNWSYTFDTSTGDTAITFNVGAQLSGLYGAGTVGSVTFAGTILDLYPEPINGVLDNVSGANGFLRENDSVNTSSSSNTAGSLYDFQGGTSYSASVGSISDDTATPVDTLPAGSLTQQVAYVDGVAYTGQDIKPGDTVVYELTYTLPEGGNFGDLTLAAYLPEPVFSVLYPANPDQTTTADFAGSGTSTFIESNIAVTNAADASGLVAGDYTYNLSSGLQTDGVTITGGTGSEPTNSVAFQAQSPGAQTYYYSGNQAPQTITVFVAVTASSEPFVNGLDLTSQADSSFTPAHAATFSRQTIAMVHMGEPALSVDQGVVSIVDDSGTVIDGSVTWSNGATSAPTAVFTAAGSGGSALVGGTGPAALVAADDNLNLAGAQAGDTVRIVDAVQNTGDFAAYDVVLKDALAQGLNPSEVSNLTFTLGNGTVLSVLDPTTDAAPTNVVDSFFSSTGVLLVNGTTGSPVLSASGSNTDIVYVTYDVTLPSNTPTAASLTGQASIVAWTNHDVYTYTGTGVGYTLTDPTNSYDANFADDTALGAVLTDTATVTTLAPTLTDDITGGTDASDAGATVPTNTYPGHAATTVPGETVDLSATITLPQGDSTNVTLNDILPAGLTPVTTPGTYTVTLTQNDGTIVDLTADAVWVGQKLILTIPTPDAQVAAHVGGDLVATVVVDYQALVPQTQATPIDTSTWSSATFGNTTLTDHFTATSEGLGYGTTTETSTTTTTGSTTKSGVANVITVTNPLVTSTLTETNVTPGSTVYSQEPITYQVTLTNTSTTATAYDAGATIALPTGLAYVAGSLTETSAAPGTVSSGNVGSDGAGPAGDAVSGFTLAPGATAVFTFQATVDNNLTAGTTLKVTSQPAWSSLPASVTVDGAGNVNPNAQAYVGALGTVQNSVAVIAPTLSVVGSSNDTALLGTADGGQLFDPNGTVLPTPVVTTDGEIVRMRATLQLPEGSNSNVSMAVTLPTGLTLDPNYATDGSITVLLVSPNGDFTTTLSGTELTEGGTAIATGKLDLGTGGDSSDPVVASLLPAGSVQVSGQTVTFNLGTLANNDASGTVPNYVIVEFNTVVGAVAGGTSLTTTMQGSANSATTTTVSDHITVEAPVVTLAKQITGITYNNGAATITYVDTITNNGDGPAYGLTLTDPGAGVGAATPGTTPSGSGVGASIGVDGTGIQAMLTSLPGSGGAQSFTYRVTIPEGQVDQAVSDAASTATVVSAALNPAHETTGHETLSGTSLTPATSSATASAGLDLVSGTVNQDVGAQGTDLPANLVPLDAQTVSVTFTGQTAGTESVQTGSDGTYAVLVPDGATSVTITANASGSKAPANDVLDNNPSLTASLTGTTPSAVGTNPVTLSFTPASDQSYTGVAFDFWHTLDTAPALAGAPGSATTFTIGGTPVPIFPAGAVSDPQLDGSFGSDFSGTTLVIQRYVSNAAAPNSGDVFTGSGTAGSGVYLNTSNDQVLYNGSAVGTFSETGGKLTISFAATGVSNVIADDVLRGLVYSFTGASNTLTPGVVIGAQIDDANNDPIGLNGFTPDASGPHDQGPGGDLLSNVLVATIDVAPQAAAATFIEPNDANPANAPYPVVVDGTANLGDILNTATPPSAISLTITNVQPEDVLVFANTADIQGSYTDGTLTLTAVNGHTPTLAEWQTALQSVTYYDTSAVPDTTTRNVTISITDGANSSSGTGTIAIVPVDDSPILNTAVPVTLNDSLEFQGTGTPTPSGAVGTLVSQLDGLSTGSTPANVTDSDGPGLTNGGVPTTTGIAITGFSTTAVGGTPEGTWYYSTNGGASWTAFPAGISAQQPLDLAASARIYFQPTDPNFNGQIPDAITFRAWDQFDGTANGTQANLSGVTAFGQNAADNTAATAYSIATESLPLMVDNVNNAPTAAGSATLPSVSTANHAPPGETVAQLFGPGFSDTADQQYNATANPTGSLANPLAGVAIVGDAATPNQGFWEYSLNGGASFTPIPTGVSNGAALILPAGAKIAFQPENGFAGTPGALTVRLIDSSTTPIEPGLTGASLAVDTGTAYAGVNVTANGGSTAISANTVPLDTTIIALPGTTGTPVPPSPLAPPPGNFPDDLTLALYSNPNFAITDDLLGRTIIPELSLIGSEADHYVIVEQHAIIALPPNLFVDSLPNASLTFDAKQPDGSPLPSWLSFDPTTLTFYGTPPESAVGRVEIIIIATDIIDNTADATFSILVGHKEQDLIGLISGRRPGGFSLTPGNIRHLRLGDARPNPNHPRLVHTEPAHHEAVAPVAATATPPVRPHVAGLGGFSGALRGAGPMGALTRARALLDALESLTRSRPAA